MGKIGILFWAMIIIVWAQDNIDIDKTCIYNSKGIYWNLGDLKKDDGNYSAKSPYDTTTNVVFNIWKQVQWRSTDSYAVIQRDDGSWSLLTDDANNPTVSAINNEDIDLVFHYTGQDVWKEDGTKKYSFELKVTCSDDASDDPQWVESTDDKWTVTIQWKNSNGCPIIKANAIWNFFNKYKTYLTPAIIVIGLYFLVLGAYFTRISVFLIIFVTTIFAVLFVMYAIILPYSTPDYVGWIILPAAAVAGLVIAGLTTTFLKIGVFLIGWWGGGMLATWLFQMIIYKISSKTIVLWIMIAVFALILGIIALKFLKFVMIVGTSFIGSYLTVRGVSFYLGGYPNEFQMYNDIQVGDFDNVPYTMYLYVAGMLVLSIIGIIFQHKRFKICKRSSKDGNAYQKI